MRIHRVLALVSILVATFVPRYSSAEQAQLWYPFKLGLTDTHLTTLNVVVEDITFKNQSGLGPYIPGYLEATFNVKNLAPNKQNISVSIALFDQNKNLLCAGGTQISGLESHVARSLRVTFGVCGYDYAREGKLKLFQVVAYASPMR